MYKRQANYFWRYVNYEVTNDAFVDQYVAPLNVRASGYELTESGNSLAYVESPNLLQWKAQKYFDRSRLAEYRPAEDVYKRQL